MGDQTKAELFPDAELRKELDKFFLGAKLVGESINSSSTALVTNANSLNPARWAAGWAGGKLFFTPQGQKALLEPRFPGRFGATWPPLPGGGGAPRGPQGAEGGSGGTAAGSKEPRTAQLPVHADIAQEFAKSTEDFRGRPEEALEWVRRTPGGFARGAIPHPQLPEGIGLSHFGVTHADEARAAQGMPSYLDEAVKTISSLPVSEVRPNPVTGGPGKIILKDPNTRRFAIIERNMKGHETPAWLLTTYGRLPK
jgi:hypothetical protein